MSTILIKIFATALALSQVTTQPHAVKTHFDPAADQQQVVQILRAGCAHMRQAFDIESVNLDALISTALDDPKAVGAGPEAFHGINFSDLNTAYHQFCKNEAITKPVVDMGQVIDFYNNAAADLPDPARLTGHKLPNLSFVLDDKGKEFADVFQAGNRRIWVPLADVPADVQKAFIAAEDRRFYQHHGVDEHGIIRAFIGNLGDSGQPQGGSTITQQVVKNLLVGDDVTYERKIREMIVASRLENVMSKADILELYLNSAYLGRASWGIEMAARSYFGKTAKTLTLGEGAMLAGLLKGPNYFNPDRHPQRAHERLAYVLGRMQEDGDITAAQKEQALAAPPKLIPFVRPRRDGGFGFVDYLAREAKSAGIDNLTAAPYTVHSTIDATLQRDTEAALQEGLARYEISAGRMHFSGPEANIADAVQKISAAAAATTTSSPPAGTPVAEAAAAPSLPAWQQALRAVQLPLYDVQWTPAVVLDKPGRQRDGNIHVGLADGRILPLTTYSGEVRRSLNPYDVIYVHVTEGREAAKGRHAIPARAELRVRPTVQGAALVLQNKTGRILAMAGSFSYPLSQLNRTTQTQRQPGSAIKPLTYLAALQAGLQPNTLILDEPITLPPIGSGDDADRDIARDDTSARDEDYWTPRNYGNGSGGVYTLRRGLEHSRNIITARLLDGGIADTPEKSLDRVCALALEAKIYTDCIRYYPFVLGAEPVRMIDLAAFYAAVANEGARPRPHGIDSIEENGKTVYAYPATPPTWIGSADRTSFYQLKTILQGVVARGTARSIAELSPYVGGKTGTTEDSVDAWFVGFTNDVTVAIWVGYDNGDGKRRSLGDSATGSRVALPIFTPIIEAVWKDHVAPKIPLSGPSAEARRHLIDLPIDYMSGDRVSGSRGAFMEHFRLGADGRFDETQHQLVSHEEASEEAPPPTSGWRALGSGARPPPPGYGNSARNYYPGAQQPDYGYGSPGWQQPRWQALPPQPPPPRPMARGLFSPYYDSDDPPAPVRRNPDYFWGGRFN